MSVLCNSALAKGKKGLALGRRYHLAKKTQMLCERELTWHLHGAGVCRFIPACRGHGEGFLITETTMLSLPSSWPGSLGSYNVPSFLQLLCSCRTAPWGGRSRAAESLCGVIHRYPNTSNSHTLHSLELRLCCSGGLAHCCPAVPVCVPALGSLVVCSVCGGRHCNCKLLGRHLNHTDSSLDMHALSGHVLTAVLAL